MNMNMKIRQMSQEMKRMNALNRALIKKNVVSVKELEDELDGKQ